MEPGGSLPHSRGLSNNMVSYIKGGMQAKGIWKQDPEANIWAQEG